MPEQLMYAAACSNPGDRHVAFSATRVVLAAGGGYRDARVRAIDYDDRLHARYVEGSRLPPEVLAAWVVAFGHWLPERRPLRLADVGSGTGRFTSSLVGAFGGPVLGIEPSMRMRALAAAGSAHQSVWFVGGRCEAIPLGDHALDGVLLFGVWHHLADRAAGATELARVVRPDGMLLLRTSPSDRLARPWWDEWLPEVHETDRTLLPSLSETMTSITSAGWELVAIDEVAIPSVLTRRQDVERLKHRSLSTLEYLDDSIVDDGLERIAAAVAADPHADHPAPIAPQHLLVFRHL